jgi:hypothetical protein
MSKLIELCKDRFYRNNKSRTYLVNYKASYSDTYYKRTYIAKTLAGAQEQFFEYLKTQRTMANLYMTWEEINK